MNTAVADRVAKLLRVACSTGPDGEKLAALNRLSAIVTMRGIDWDQAFSGGYADRPQQARPARDWTPAGSTSAEVGDDAERLETILNAAAESATAGLLSEWETTFSADMRERFERFGSRTFVSEKQWASLDRLEAKLRRQDFL